MIRLFLGLLWKELYDLARQPWLLAGVFLVPLYLMHVSTTLDPPDAPVRVLLSHPAADPGGFRAEIDKVVHLQGIETVVVRADQEMKRAMAEHRASVGVAFSDYGGPQYFERSRSGAERRLNFAIAAKLDMALRNNDDWIAAVMAGYLRGEGPSLELTHLSMMPAADGQKFPPRFLALALVFLAALLGARCLLRELESRTLPLLMTAPHGSWSLVLAAKLAFVVALVATVLAFLLLTLHPLFGFYIHAGVVGIYAAASLAVCASACVGMALALLGGSTTQAHLAVSVYLIGNLILTGFVSAAPALAASGEKVLHVLFPLTYLRTVFEDWMFFGEPTHWHGDDMVALSVHAGASLLLLYAISARRRRQL